MENGYVMESCEVRVSCDGNLVKEEGPVVGEEEVEVVEEVEVEEVEEEEEEEDVGVVQGNGKGEGLAWLPSLQDESLIPGSSRSEC